MNKAFILATLLATASPVFAQDTLTSTSGSNAGAVSGSASGASSDNQNANVQNGNIGVSENTNTSTSNSGAVSGSESTSGSFSDQAQGQDQGQNQGQSQGQSQDQNLSAQNEQGVTVNQTWNTRNRRQTEIRTNNAVPLAASSSFSSDYCGGTVSGGVSAAPIGISVGGSGVKFDRSCQSLRRAEKFGMAAVNASNMGQRDLSGRLMSMMIWSICTSDSDGTDRIQDTAQACDKLLLLGGSASAYGSAQPAAAPASSPQVAINGKVSPEAAFKAGTQSAQNDKATVVAAVTK